MKGFVYCYREKSTGNIAYAGETRMEHPVSDETRNRISTTKCKYADWFRRYKEHGGTMTWNEFTHKHKGVIR